MKETNAITVYTRDGLRGTAEPAVASGGGWVLVRMDEGLDLLVPLDLLAPRGDGGYDLPLASDEIPRRRAESTTVGEVVLPVAEERLRIGKRRVETGKVVIKKTVHEHEEVVDVPVSKEEVQVERVPVNRYVEGPIEPRQEGDVTVIPVVEEVLVVEKKLLLREEVRISRRPSETRERRKVALRREEVEIERRPAQPAGTQAATAH